MKIIELIEDFKKDVTWVNYNFTRDQILAGDENLEVSKIGVCWVATKKVLEEAKEKGVNFIISHENFLYVEGTSIYGGYIKSRKEKKKFCQENGIVVYRLHDGWDQFPVYGVSDKLAESLKLNFEKREIKEFNQLCHINEEMTAREIAEKFAEAFAPYGCDYVEVLGNADKKIKTLAIGVGAATNIPQMHVMGADCVMLADDGGNNWIEQQWLLDNDIPAIICHHSINEMAGIDGMQQYFSKKYPEYEVIRLNEGFKYTLVKKN